MKKIYSNKKIIKENKSIRILDIDKKEMQHLSESKKYTIKILDKFEPKSEITSNTLIKVVKDAILTMPEFKEKFKKIFEEMIE